MVSKAFYQEKLESALETSQKELEELRATAQLQEADSRDESTAQQEELSSRITLIETKIQELHESENGLWTKLKSELDDIFHRMGSGFEKVAAPNATKAVIESSDVEET